MTEQGASPLETIRAEIETIDRDIVSSIARRLDLCRAIVPHKMEAGLPPHLPYRVDLVIERWSNAADERGVDRSFIAKICRQVIAEGERLQTDMMADDQ